MYQAAAMTPSDFRPRSNSKDRTLERNRGNELRFLASIASNQTSIPSTQTSSNNGYYPSQHPASFQPQSPPSYDNQSNPNRNQYGGNRSSFALNKWLNESGVIDHPDHTNNILDDLKAFQTQFARQSRSYKDDRNGFVLFVHVLLKCLSKQRSDRELYYKAKSIVAECISCRRSNIPGYSPLVDTIEERLRQVDGMQVYIDKAEGYMCRYRERNGSEIQS